MLRLIKRLLSHLDNSRKIKLVIVFILMILGSFAELLGIGAIVPFLGVLTSPETVFSNEYFIFLNNSFFGYQNADEIILPVTIFFVICVFFSAGIRIIMLWFQIRVSHAIGSDISILIYKKSLYKTYEEHLQRNSGEVIAAVTSKSTGIVSSTVLPLLLIISSILTIALISILLFSVNPLIASITMFSFSLLYLITILLSKNILSRYSETVSYEQSMIVKTLQDGFGAIRDILIYRSQEAYTEKYRNHDISMRHAQGGIQVIGSMPRVIVESFGVIVLSLIAFFISLGPNGISGAITLLGLLGLSAQRLLPLLQLTYNSFVSIKGGRFALMDALDLLDSPIIIDDDDHVELDFNKEIKFQNIQYFYPNQKIPAIKNINFSIKKGEKIGIVGVTGGGKSTFVDILMGLLKPSKGSIFIDDHELISDIDFLKWQKKISNVSQNIFLSDSTIAENIALGLQYHDIDLQKVKEVAKIASIHEDIQEFQGGYNNVVGERGIRISGGQRQRIGIARALYRGTEVLVLDEATSALDQNTEESINNLISELNKKITVISIAHRISTLKDFDKIINIQDGSIDWIGTYKEYLNRDK